jgi:hypothetical protein
LIIALILLVVAFGLGAYDWDGFLLSLATEIIGAIVILLLVEHRLRASDMHLLQSLPETTRYAVADWFFGDTLAVRAYVGVLVLRIRSVAQPRLPRHEIEEKLLKNRKQGLVIVGRPGTGKTTLMHFLVNEQAQEVSEEPHTAHVPILVAARDWGEQEVVDALRITMQSYYPVPEGTFKRLLKRGRLMCFFDGLDETLPPTSLTARLQQLQRFHLRHPDNPLIVSMRALGHDVVEDLVHIEIPSLTTLEVEELLSLRRDNTGE